MTACIPTVALICLAVSTLHCLAADIYVSQSGTGSGASCKDTHSVSWLNAGSSWGTNPTQIGPGSVVHLCGVISSPLAIQASGSDGAPITLRWEADARVSLSTWTPGSGAVSCSGGDHIVIDGGSNGVIEATANGTQLAQHDNLFGVYLNNCSHSEVKNLTVRSLYVRTPLSADTCACGQGIRVDNSSDVQVDHNVVQDAAQAFVFVFGDNSEVHYFSNRASRTSACFAFSPQGAATATAVTIHDNDCSDLFVWWDPADNNHLDGVHAWTQTAGANLSGLRIYNNYFHGDWHDSAHTTAHIFVENGPGTLTGALLYNNLFAAEYVPSNGFIYLKGTANAGIYNNTGIGSGSGLGFQTSGASGTSIENNILSSLDVFFSFSGSGSVATSDHNIFHNGGSGFSYNGNNYNSLSAWQGTGFDAHSLSSDPLVAASGDISSASPAGGSGANLSSLFSTDKNNTTRPAQANWAIGCREVAADQGTKPSPPTNVIVTVN